MGYNYMGDSCQLAIPWPFLALSKVVFFMDNKVQTVRHQTLVHPIRREHTFQNKYDSYSRSEKNIQSNLDISKLMVLFFTSSNYPKCKLICTSGNVDL